MTSGNIYLHTVQNNHLDFFDEDNIQFISKKITEILAKQYKNVRVIITRASIIRAMGRQVDRRLDTVPRMNQRVIMDIVGEYRRHQVEVNKHLRWEEGFPSSQLLVDPVGRIAAIPNNQLSKIENSTAVGGTLNFYFT